jgi:hypothetical protein
VLSSRKTRRADGLSTTRSLGASGVRSVIRSAAAVVPLDLPREQVREVAAQRMLLEAMQTAVKLTVQVGVDHVVKLPDEVPVGPAEIIVLVGEPTPAVVLLDDFEPIDPVSPLRLSDLVNEDRG